MIITINGRPGSGKSTMATRLAKVLHYRTIDMGQIRRKAIQQSGMSFMEFNKWSLAHPDKGDKIFDQFLIREVKKTKRAVISSRTAFHFFPKAFNVFLDVNPKEGVRRMYGHRSHRPGELTKSSSLSAIQRISVERVREERRRFRKLYGVDIYNPKNYSFVLDTTKLSRPMMVKRVVQAFQNWQKTQK
jgi:cytidylate kinase